MSDDSSAKPKPSKVNLGRLLATVGWPIVSFYAVSVALFLALSALNSVSGGNLEDLYETSNAFQFAFNAVTSLSIMFVAVWPFASYLFGSKAALKQALGFTRRPKLTDVGWALVTWGAYFAASLLALLAVIQLVPGFDAEQVQDLGQPEASAPWQYILIFVALVVIPPFVEEVIFRGYMFGGLRKQFGFWVSAIVVSLAFAMVHGQFNVGLDTFVLSMFACLLREKTGSLWASIGLHAFKNGLAFVVLVSSGQL